jgi:hypothetical protein
MNIEIDYSIDFKSKEVFEFIFDTTQNIYRSPFPVVENYTASGTILAGKIRQTEEVIDDAIQTKPLKLFGQVKEHYSVFSGRTLISNFEVLIPVEQAIELSIICHLFIKTGTSPEDIVKIKQAYNSYDVNSGIDPIEYAKQKATELEISEDIFNVKNSFEFMRIGELTEHRGEVDRKLAIVNNNEIHLSGFGEGEDKKYFQRLRYRAVPDKREILYNFEEPIKDELHEGEGSDTSQITDTIKVEVLKEIDCEIDPTNRIEEKIATVFAYPEFKLDWEVKWIKIGCIKTKLYLPVAYKRLTKKVLYAYIGLPDDIVDRAKDQIRNCAIDSALAAAVIGIIFENLAAALYSYKALFVECLKRKAYGLVDCLFPGLFILTEKTRWSRL